MRRILTAIILIPLVVALVLWGPLHLMVAVEVSIAIAGVWEYSRLAEAAGFQMLRFPGFLYTAAIGALPLAGVLENTGTAGAEWGFPAWLVALTLFFAGIVMVAAMRGGGALSGYFGSVAVSCLGPIYVVVPLALLVSVWAQEDGPYRLLFALVVIWTSDTAAYFVGKNLGRNKCCPRISPNKTWEGVGGSLVGALLVGFVWGVWLDGGRVWWELLPLAVALNAAGQLGDLTESALKRSAGVKDSSQLIPGHGGVLDRVDALLFAAPVLWYYWAAQPGGLANLIL
jgi:phosphatidate cytidylyltransferase